MATPEKPLTIAGPVWKRVVFSTFLFGAVWAPSYLLIHSDPAISIPLIGGIVAVVVYWSRSIFKAWNHAELKTVKVSTSGAEATFIVDDRDRAAAWRVFVQIMTRVGSQALPEDDGDALAALASIFTLFQSIRVEVIKAGPTIHDSEKLVELEAIRLLNQTLRPFLAKWHSASIEAKNSDGKLDPKRDAALRAELRSLQPELVKAARVFGDVAEVKQIDKFF